MITSYFVGMTNETESAYYGIRNVTDQFSFRFPNQYKLQ